MGNAYYTPDYVAELEQNQELLQERLDDVVRMMNDAAWEPLTALDDSPTGARLESIKTSAVLLRDMVDTSPLFKRGHELRHNYCYSRGWRLDYIKPLTQKAMDDPYNYDALFSNQALSSGIKARHTDGNRFVLKRKDGQLIPVSIDQISDALVDPDDAGRIRFIKRSWSVSGVNYEKWYPTYEYTKSGAKIPTTIQTPLGSESVDKTAVMFVKRYNRPTGATWGLPDFLPAMLWAKAYASYLKDNTALVKAYARIALKISAPTAKAATGASASIANQRGVGGTALMGENYLMEAMPTNGSQVNFNNGRALAAMVAASFGVSIVALLSDPGTGGSFGVAETLDPPTLLMARGLQTDERDLFLPILRSYRNPEAQLQFPTIETDPVYRAVQSIAQLTAQGVFYREEARAKALELLDIESPKTGLPKPDGFNNWSDPHPPAPVVQAPGEEPEDKVDPTPRRGNSGAAGSIDQGTNNDARDNGEYDQ